MHFEFATATRIVFGPGKITEAIAAAASLGRRALIVHGRKAGRHDWLEKELRARGVQCTPFSTLGEPTIARIAEGVRTAKEARCELVIGFGGGSAMDGAKAIAALTANPGDPLDYLEVVGRGMPLTRPCAPCICIPTTAGTGSEVTRNAVLVSPEHRVKVSLRSAGMFPSLAVVDPELTLSLPPADTAGTGMDALTQLIEPFVCNKANPFTDALCREGLYRGAHWLRAAYYEGTNAEARENMSLASLFGGLALANAGLGVVHGLAAPLGGLLPIPHGFVCARLLPFAIETNLRALHTRAGDSPAVARYEEIARILTGRPSARAREAADWLHSLCSELSIPPLSAFGLTAADIPGIAEKASGASSMKGNPVQLTADELAALLSRAL